MSNLERLQKEKKDNEDEKGSKGEKRKEGSCATVESTFIGWMEDRCTLYYILPYNSYTSNIQISLISMGRANQNKSHVS